MQLEKKAHQLYKFMDEVDFKKAHKSIKKSIESARSVVEELFYKTGLAYLHDKNHKNVESKELLDEIMQRVVEGKIFDDFLVDHFMSICNELGYPDMSVKVAEARYNDDPNDQKCALQMFDTYVSTNDFMKMNATSMKIATTFGFSEFSIHSIQSLYMLSQSDGALPNTIDLAYMFAKRHMDKFKDEDKVFPCDGKLYLKILKKKGMSQEASMFIQKHPETFSGDLERARENIDILQGEINILKQKGKLLDLKVPQSRLIEEIRKVIKQNYEKPAEFNSIYDLYEILINTLVDVLSEDINEHELVKLYNDTKESEAKESELFELIQEGEAYTIESIKTLWRSLIFYQDFEAETNKSTEAHNLRKASILSQLYLMHRMVLAGVKYDPENTPKNIFTDICLNYTKRYIQLSSVVYDLKGYFPYLSSDFITPLEAILEEDLKGRFKT